MPDSTTKERSFSVGEDIFVTNKKDGKLYLGTIIHVEVSQERCLVKFGDNTQVWSKFDHLLRLNKSVSERPVCVVCKKSNTNNTHNHCSNDIVRCDKCGRGYHQLCHLVSVLCIFFFSRMDFLFQNIVL
jgi:polycomb-like protein 2